MQSPNLESAKAQRPIKRWLTWFALATVFAIACWFLSQWQLSRLNEVREAIARIDANYGSAPVELSQLVPTLVSTNATDEYQPVTLSGHYLADKLALVRNRPLNGVPGFEEFVPFELDGGQIIIVDRGWLATGSQQDLPDNLTSPPTEPTQLVARLRVSAPDSMRNYPAGQVFQLGATSVAEMVRVANLESNSVYQDWYLALQSETRLDGSEVGTENSPKPLGKPDITEGNHLSYAMQWILFALMAFFAIFWAIRQERLATRQAADPSFVAKKRKAVGSKDAEIEDAIVDSKN